jgi:UPF0271 protein
MNYILDSSVFFSDYPVRFPAYTTPSVIDELIDLRSKCRFDSLVVSGLVVREPESESVLKIQEVSARSGDQPVLSPADKDVLALALDLGGVIVTDDFSVQNVAHHLGIETRSILQRPARTRVWKFRCSGCGRYYRNTGECPVCGSAIKRKLK